MIEKTHNISLFGVKVLKYKIYSWQTVGVSEGAWQECSGSQDGGSDGAEGNIASPALDLSYNDRLSSQPRPSPPLLDKRLLRGYGGRGGQ